MKTRDYVIEYQKTLDDAGTLIKDITVRDPVSALYFEFEATNGTTSNKGNFLSDVITKVEIVDGSQVLYSLNLSQLEALNFYKTGKTPYLLPSEHGSGHQVHGVNLMFGRRMFDQNYAMDFSKYKNPQLKITSNLSAVRAVSATTAFATGTLKATVVAKVMEDLTSPSMYLGAKQVNNFTSVTSGEKRIDMPTDYLYRLLLCRFYVQLSDINEVITDLKMTCDADKFTAFNRKVKQLDAEALNQFGLCIFKHDIFTQDLAAFRELNNKENFGRWATFADTAGIVVNVNYEWSSEGKLDMISNANAAITADTKLTGMECGHALHATLPIPFGIMDEPNTWFDPKPYGKIELVATQAVAATCEIAVEQAIPVG